MKVPNRKVKRGWSQHGIKWRFDVGSLDELPAIIWCREQRYRLHVEDGKPFYVYDPDLVVRARLMAAAHHLLANPLAEHSPGTTLSRLG